MKPETNPPTDLTSNTSWGYSDREIDTRTMRRYYNLLRLAGNIGEVVFFVLLFFLVVLVPIVLFGTVWELPIFSDGTDLVCIFDHDAQVTHRIP